MILVTKHYCIYTITSISDPVGKMSWYLNLLFRLKIQSLIDHTWAKRGVSVCFHYLKVNTCNVYALYVVIVLVLNPFHTIFSLVTSLPYPLDIKSIFLNSNSTSMYLKHFISMACSISILADFVEVCVTCSVIAEIK